MYCEKCGNVLGAGALFCRECGAPTTDGQTSVSNHGSNHSESFSGQGSTSQPPIYNSLDQRQQQYQGGYYARPIYKRGEHPFNFLGGFLLVLVIAGFVIGAIVIVSEIVSFIKMLKISSGSGKSISGSDWDYISRELRRELSGSKSYSGSSALYYIDMWGGLVLNVLSGSFLVAFADKFRKREYSALGFLQTSAVAFVIAHCIFFIITVDYQSFSGTMIFIWLLFAIVCSVYCPVSVRVRTFMRSDKYLRYSLFNKNSVSPPPADDYYEEKKNTFLDGSNRDVLNVKTMSKSNIPNQFNHRPDWECNNCGEKNPSNLSRCKNCGQMK